MSERKSIHDGWTPQPQEQEQPGDPLAVPADPPSPLTAALVLLRRSVEGRCGNPLCPSEHVNWGEDCIEFALSQVESAALAPSPAPAGGPTPEGYWWCHRHQLDTRTPEDHNLHEKDCHHFAALASSPAPAGLDELREFVDRETRLGTITRSVGGAILSRIDRIGTARAATRPAEDAGK